ncbi:hypothetical protein HY640_04300, partial [Candidatus Woesearchaeota archaeon]|nr:hypothetical protein [Candidatus Woesearchaeota archaeon]
MLAVVLAALSFAAGSGPFFSFSGSGPATEMRLSSVKPGFAAYEDAEFIVEYPGKLKVREGLSSATGFVVADSVSDSSGKDSIAASVKDAYGRTYNSTIDVSELDSGKYSLKVRKGRQFKPGKFKFNVEFTKDGFYVKQEQDFTWGVLAVNPHKSIYAPGETAFMSMAVLDDYGRMVCDAEVLLSIKDPYGNEQLLANGAGVHVSPECNRYGETSLPDYYANYTVGPEGAYTVNITARTKNGERSLMDSFLVSKKRPFDLVRNAPTRIYPRIKYPVSIGITANQDFEGEIKEVVPSSFAVLGQSGFWIQDSEEEKILSWQVSLRKGGFLQLNYTFDAPDVTPQAYRLGPLQIGSFKESRQWSIASDALGSQQQKTVVLFIMQEPGNYSLMNTFYNSTIKTIYLPELNPSFVGAWVEMGWTSTTTNLAGSNSNRSVLWINSTPASYLMSDGNFFSEPLTQVRFLNASHIGKLSLKQGNNDINFTFNMSPGDSSQGGINGPYAKLYLTYAYDDASPEQLFTVRTFINQTAADKPLTLASNGNEPGVNATFVFPAIKGLPPSAVVRDMFIEVTGATEVSASRGIGYNFTLDDASQPNFDMWSTGPGDRAMFLPQVTGSVNWRYLYQNKTVGGFNPFAAHTFKFRNSTVTNGIATYGLANLNAELYLTYSMDTTLDTTRLETMTYLIGQNTSGWGMTNDQHTPSYGNAISLPQQNAAVQDAYMVVRGLFSKGSASGFHRANLTVRGWISGDAFTGAINHSLAHSGDGTVPPNSFTILYRNFTPADFSGFSNGDLVMCNFSMSQTSGASNALGVSSPSCELVITYNYSYVNSTSLAKTVGFFATSPGASSAVDINEKYTTSTPSTEVDPTTQNAYLAVSWVASDSTVYASLKQNVTNSTQPDHQNVSIYLADAIPGNLISFLNTTKNMSNINAQYNLGLTMTRWAPVSAVQWVTYSYTKPSDTVPPLVKLLLPENFGNVSSSEVLFNFTAYDVDGLNHSELLINFSGTFEQNNTNFTRPVFTGINTSVNVTLPPEGSFNWSVRVCDFWGNCNSSTSNFTVFLDRTAPNASLVGISNGTAFSGAMSINASVNDTLTHVMSVYFRFSNVSGEATSWLAANFSSGTVGIGYWNYTHPKNALAEGPYNISINATDFALNSRFIGNHTNIRVVIPPSNITFTFSDQDNLTVGLKRNYSFMNFSIDNTTNPILNVVVNWNGTNVTVDSPELVFGLGMNNATYDMSRYSRNVTSNGVNCSTAIIGKFGYGCELQGTTPLKNLTANVTGFNTTAFTLMLWVNASSFDQPEYSGLFSNGPVVNGSFQIDIGGSEAGCVGQYRFSGMNDSGFDITACFGSTYSQNWTHLAVSSNGTYIRLYQNGVLRAENVTSLFTANFSRFTLGVNRESSRPFNGTFDELRLWNRTLSDAEINASFDAEIVRFNGTTNYSVNFTSLKEGNYSYFIWSNDSATTNSTSNRVLVVDYTVPSIAFVSNGDSDNTSVSRLRNYTFVNFTFVDVSAVRSAIINFNGTNVTVDSPGLVWALGLNNNTDDRSRYGRNATNYGVNCSTLIGGRFGYACQFPGFGAHRNLSTRVAFNTSNFTLMFWVNSSLNQRDASGVFSINSPVNGSFQIDLGAADACAGQYRLLFINDSGFSLSSCLGPYTENWTHIAIASNGSHIRAYANGVLKAENITNSFTANFSRLALGVNMTSDGAFNGSIDEVRLWNRTLSHAEINFSYNAELGKANDSVPRSYFANFTEFAEGNYTYFVWADDIAENANSSVNRALLVDYTPPFVNFTLWTLANNSYSSNWTMANVSFREPYNHSFIISFNGTNYSNRNFSVGAANINFRFFYANITNLSDGNYTYYGWVNDTAGNSNQTEARLLVIDNIAPTISAVAFSSNNSGRMFIYTNSSASALIYFNALGGEGDGQNITVQVSASDVYIGNLSGNTTFSDTPLSTASAYQMFVSYTIEENSVNASTLAAVFDRARNLGNVTVSWANDSVDPVTVDNAPVDSMSSWFTGAVNITLNASDIGAGVNRTYWCVYTAGTTPCFPSAIAFNITSWVQLNCSQGSACSWVIRYYSTDNVSNNESGGANGGSVRSSSVVQVENGVDVDDTLMNNSNISGSYVRNSNLTNSSISACSVQNSVLVRSSVAWNQTHRYNCTVHSSTLIDVNMTSGVIRNSFIDPSTVVDSVIENSNISNGSVFFSRVENTTFCAPGIYAYEAIIRNSTLVSGLVRYNGTSYFGPYPLSAVCAGLKPSPAGVLTATPNVTNNTGTILFRYYVSSVGYNVSINKTEFQKKLHNTTVSDAILRDDGAYPDDTQGDAIYTANFTLNTNNNLTDNQTTLIADVDDALGNRWNVNVTVWLDNTAPNASISINAGAASTDSGVVVVSLGFNDSVGVRDCRFANEDRVFDPWEACTGSKGWLLTSTTGTKTVVVQVRDLGYNINETNDTITLTTSTSATVTGPGIVFVFPTDDDKSFINRTWSFVNVTVGNSSALHSVVFNWNGSNQSLTLNSTAVYSINRTSLSDGNYSYYVWANDSNAATGQSAVRTLIVDTLFPNASLVINGGASTSSSTLVSLAVSANDTNSRVKCRFSNENRAFTSWETCTENRAWTVVSGVGSKTVVLQVRDAAGNVNETNASINVVTSTSPPAPSVLFISPTDDDKSFIARNWSFVNVTVANNSQIHTVLLSWNGSNQSLTLNSTAIYSINKTSLSDGNYTYYIWINDTSGAYGQTAVRTLVVDTVLPNASIAVQGLGAAGITNVSSEFTSSRSVLLVLSFNDSWVDSCRFANEDLGFTPFEPCSSSKSWVLSAGDGNKTVVLEVRDRAGNMNRTNDTIFFNSSGAGLDVTPPAAPSVFDDGLYTITKYALHARWNSSDFENELLHIPLQYEYRISFNSSNNFVNGSGFLSVGTSADVWVFGLDLQNGTNYTFELRAVNSAGLRSSVGYSDGIIVDISPPTAPSVSSNHTFSWTSNNTPLFTWYSNDSISGIKGYSYILDTSSNTVPDNVEELETEHALLLSQVNTGQQQVLKYNSTGNASAVFVELRQNLTALDVLKVTVYASESHVETPDIMGLQVYAIQSVPTAFNMTGSNITTMADVSSDVGFRQPSNAESLSFDVMSSVNVTSGSFFIAVAGVFSDDDNNYNLLVAGSNLTGSIDNSTQSYLCMEGSSCSNHTNSFEYAVSVERHDLRGDGLWDKSYTVGDGVLFFHVKSLDKAGNFGDTTTYNISVDTSAPSVPQMAQPVKRTSNSTISFEWTRSTDPHSGVDNYYLVVDNDSDMATPDFSGWVGNITNRTVTVSNVSTLYYARVHSSNLAGVNSSPSSSVTTFLDINPPQVTYLRPKGTIIRSATTVAVTTNETSVCSFQVGAGPSQSFAFTNSTYHESSISVADGDSVSVVCYDLVNNAGSASSGSITVSSLSPSSVTLSPSSKSAFTDEVSRLDVIVKSGSTNIGGLSSESFQLFLDTVSQPISVTDNGQGNYTLAFTAPRVNGSVNLTATVSGVASEGTLNVQNVLFSVQFINSSLSPQSKERMTYTLVNNNFSIG